MNPGDISKLKILRYRQKALGEFSDSVAVEEPLEISIMQNNAEMLVKKNISITMRTPGNDRELALGFLFTEGILNSARDVLEIIQDENSICIIPQKEARLDLSKIERHFYTSSSCGVCGKSSIDSLRTLKKEHVIESGFTIGHEVLFSLNDKVKKQQSVFESTGGLHASALFSKEGDLISLFEDVGRHNALDKLIGSALMESRIPCNEQVLFLSGRACYELIQKAAMAGIPVICALGAPSSLAVELALEFRITLLGFLKPDSFNIYAEPSRILF